MVKKAEEIIISVNAFSKKVGVSFPAMKKAITMGYISKGMADGKINYPVALEEWNNRPNAKVIEGKEAQDKIDKKKAPGISSISITEAKRREAVFKAEKTELEVKELKGLLVRKDLVFKELFAAGQEVRASMQAIPDKHIDNILACENRQEAHSILYGAITEALESLSFKYVKI